MMLKMSKKPLTKFKPILVHFCEGLEQKMRLNFFVRLDRLLKFSGNADKLISNIMI